MNANILKRVITCFSVILVSCFFLSAQALATLNKKLIVNADGKILNINVNTLLDDKSCQVSSQLRNGDQNVRVNGSGTFDFRLSNGACQPLTRIADLTIFEENAGSETTNVASYVLTTNANGKFDKGSGSFTLLNNGQGQSVTYSGVSQSDSQDKIKFKANKQ